VLRAVAVPDAGGDTMFASMYAAYDDLSDRMQRLLSELRAKHHGGLFRAVAKGARKDALEEDVSAEHPVIRTHPVTGRKAIFVNSAFTRKIVDMKPAESQALLDFLFAHLGRPEFSCRLRWRKDTIAMWDNRCTQHRVVPDNIAAYRRMERITIQGDTPF
jgi:taurine dioxygenase